MERILRATGAMGLSSLLTVGLGAARYKFPATQLGAPGVGLLGILTTAMTFGVVLFSLGLRTFTWTALASRGPVGCTVQHDAPFVVLALSRRGADVGPSGAVAGHEPVDAVRRI